MVKDTEAKASGDVETNKNVSAATDSSHQKLVVRDTMKCERQPPVTKDTYFVPPTLLRSPHYSGGRSGMKGEENKGLEKKTSAAMGQSKTAGPMNRMFPSYNAGKGMRDGQFV